MADDSRQTLIEEGTEFEGSIRSKCPITLSGKVKGNLSAPKLTVTPTGTVDGQVKVTRLKSEGELSGEIEAEAVELAGRVSDKTVIRATELEVKLNQQSGGLQVTFGNCDLQVGQGVVSRSERRPEKIEEQSKSGDPTASSQTARVGVL